MKRILGITCIALLATVALGATLNYSAAPGDTVVINIAPAPSSSSAGPGGGSGASGSGGDVSGGCIELPYRSDVPRTDAPGGPACFWFKTPATPSARGATNISIVANRPAASKLVLSLTPNDFDHPLGEPLAKAVSYGDSGETRNMSFYVGLTVPYVITLPLATVVYANFKYTGDLDGGAIEAYLANAQ